LIKDRFGVFMIRKRFRSWADRSRVLGCPWYSNQPDAKVNPGSMAKISAVTPNSARDVLALKILWYIVISG
jgi:hypothetical protein